MKRQMFWIGLGVAVVAALVLVFVRSGHSSDRFDRAMTLGKGHLEQGDARKAIAAYQQAVQLAPESIDARLNLANACLLGGDSAEVVKQTEQALSFDHNNPAAHYLMGCAWMRLNQLEEAVKAFQQSQQIDAAVGALNFQLGLASERLGQYDEAVRQFETLAQFEPRHPSVHYQLSRLYQRLGREADAAQALAKHQEILAATPNPPSGTAVYERCKYTEPRMVFALDQPPRGTTVRFVDATATAFGGEARRFHGPLGVLDYNHDGRNSLFVMESNAFRVLGNQQGKFAPLPPVLPALTNAVYRRCLVGDLNNDGFEDVMVLGEQDSRVFRFATNGQVREATTAAGLKNLKAADGVLADLDFTGKLDLLAIPPGAPGLRVYRNLGSGYFQDNTAASGLPEALAGVRQVLVEDWKNDDLPGVFATRAGGPLLYFSKLRAGPFVNTNLAAGLPAGDLIAVGDLNNDLLPDVVVADDREITVVYSGTEERPKLALKGLHPRRLLLLDYDNDGWLDVLAWGDGVRLWRNLGRAGFEDVTSATGLDKIGVIDGLVAADFDQDGDTDLVTSSAAGLALWRNDGGNANKQLKLRLVGNRSNASGLGTRVELTAGHWRAVRTLQALPLEVGVGQHDKIEVLKTRWFDLATTLLDVPVESKPMDVVELVMPTGSCPYLYAWDGARFKFVTDILGAAPLGLPMNSTRCVEQDPDELLVLGDEQHFPPRGDAYEIRITEELREVLYLDHAQLMVVDHPADTLVLPTSKMLPGRPFLPHELWTLRPRASLQSALRSDGLDVTEALASADGRMVSPIRLREPQLRGLAEPFAVTMDFGPLPVAEPLVLVLHGWLRFGGGMANIAGSLDPNLPFPFPSLEAELPDGSWKAVPVVVGVPAGKTKTILVDLENKLPPGARRLRLSAAFELYWDFASIAVKVAPDQNQITRLTPDTADLHWRGFSEFEDLPPWLPLTPQYDRVKPTPPWSRTPSGWCTRYGAVEQLVRGRDNSLALLNGGDEVALSFAVHRLPPKPQGFVRSFFLYVVGWDKDADFHVLQGWRVEPLPFHGLDDQAYGRQPRPTSLDDSWIGKFNTRWVAPLVLEPGPP